LVAIIVISEIGFSISDFFYFLSLERSFKGYKCKGL
jgi:hypothetical protein